MKGRLRSRKPPIIGSNRWRKVGKVVTIVSAFLFLAAGLAYRMTDLSEASKNYEENLQEIKRLGLPTSAQDIDRMRAVPEAENAATLILPTLKVVRTIDRDLSLAYEEQIEKGHRLDDYPATDELFVKLWPKIESSYQTLEQASRRKRLVFHRDLTNPFYAEFPEYYPVKLWIRLMVQRAHIAEKGNRTGEAGGYLETAARLATLVQDDGFVEAIRNRMVANYYIQRELNKWLNLHGHDPLWRSQIATATHLIDKPYDLRPALRLSYWMSRYFAEVLLGLRPFKFKEENNIDENPNYEGQRSDARWLRLIPRFGKANLARVDEFFVKAIKKYPDDLYDFKTIRRDFDSFIPLYTSNALSIKVAQECVPNYFQLDDPFRKDLAKTSVLLQALAILESGKAPDGHLPLTGRYSMDLDEQPLRLKKKKEGWVIYSVDTDRQDNDGVAKTDKTKGDFFVILGAGGGR